MNKPAPFTPKQREYLLRSLSSWFNVAEGGKRGGKNVLQTMAFCINLDNHPNRLHLVAGVSSATARLNIIDCDGFGIMNYYEERCRLGQYQNRDCLYVNAPSGKKIILISGGGKNGDEKLIKGNSYGIAYITEANECAPIFLQEVFDRTISSKNRKIFHDFNPKGANHWYYTDILNFHEKQQQNNPNYGLNYGHFTIADNMSVTDEQLKRVISTYDKTSVWYERDILGKRKRAEGLIYRSFADNPKLYFIDKVPPFMEINIGMDFGGTHSKHSLVATGITPNYKKLIALRSERMDADGTTAKDVDKFAVDFVGKIIKQFGRCDYLYYDSAEQVLGRGVSEAIEKAYPSVSIRECYKPEIIDRIHLVTRLMGLDMFGYTADCTTLKEALENAVWDDKQEDTRLDDGSTDIDTLDGFEYSWTRNINRFIF